MKIGSLETEKKTLNSWKVEGGLTDKLHDYQLFNIYIYILLLHGIFFTISQTLKCLAEISGADKVNSFFPYISMVYYTIGIFHS